MADPFQNVDAAGAEFIEMFADAMDVRQSDPTMEAIVSDYLGRLPLGDGATVVEIGCGAGAVTRRIAAHAPGASVTGYDPSEGFVAEARKRAGAPPNLAFEVASGEALPLETGSVDAAVMHTVLTHVERPGALLAEAARILLPGGALAVCDADFSKATFAAFPDDPLDACARAFVNGFVTDPHIVAKLRVLLPDAGLTVTHFDVRTRLVTDPVQMRPWVEVTAKAMLERGRIGPALAEALIAEHERRAEGGTLYGYQAFGTAIAVKPG